MSKTIAEKKSGLEKARLELSGRRCLVVGLASTGISAARFLSKCGAAVEATDAKEMSELSGVGELMSLGVTIKAGGHGGITFSGGELVVVSPGVPCGLRLLEDARANGAEVISDIELAYRYLDAPVVAIAGTNGKTTTTTLIGRIFEDAGKKAFIGGNIGTPAVEYVEAGGGAEVCVLEISSFHLETTHGFNPKAGILLNITEDHLDRYRDFDHYADTKFRLFENQTPGDFAVVNMGDPVIARKAATGFGAGRAVPFTVSGELGEGLWLDGDKIIFAWEGVREEYPVSGFKLRGIHNMENIMSAVAATRLMGVDAAVIRKTLASFTGLPHRMELVRELDGVTYIDDSKGTNIGALQMALKGLSGNVILIAGGRDKGGDYGVLAGEIRAKVRLMVLIGEARLKIKEALGPLTETIMAETLEEAVTTSHRRARPGDTVLLCPACSSFDMFKSYKERGERFARLVNAL